MEPFTNYKMRSFVGEYLTFNRFIPVLAELAIPQIAKSECTISMGRGATESFQKVKDMLLSPLTMISPVKAKNRCTISMGLGVAEAFQRVKDILLSPLTMISPVKDLSQLTLVYWGSRHLFDFH